MNTVLVAATVVCLPTNHRFRGHTLRNLQIWHVRHILNCVYACVRIKCTAVCTACNDDRLITPPTMYVCVPCKRSLWCGIFRNFAFSHFTFDWNLCYFFPITHFPGHNSLPPSYASKPILCWYVFIARSFKIFFSSNTHRIEREPHVTCTK